MRKQNGDQRLIILRAVRYVSGIFIWTAVGCGAGWIAGLLLIVEPSWRVGGEQRKLSKRKSAKSCCFAEDEGTCEASSSPATAGEHPETCLIVK